MIDLSCLFLHNIAYIFLVMRERDREREKERERERERGGGVKMMENVFYSWVMLPGWNAWASQWTCLLSFGPIILNHMSIALLRSGNYHHNSISIIPRVRSTRPFPQCQMQETLARDFFFFFFFFSFAQFGIMWGFFPVWGHWLTLFVREHFCIFAWCLSPHKCRIHVQKQIEPAQMQGWRAQTAILRPNRRCQHTIMRL